MIRMGERREPHHAECHTETLQALSLQATASSEQHTAHHAGFGSLDRTHHASPNVTL